MIVEKVIDTVISSISEDIRTKYDESTYADKLRKLLIQSFEEYREIDKVAKDREVDKGVKQRESGSDYSGIYSPSDIEEVIYKIDVRLLSPNQSIDSLVQKLDTSLEACINADDKYKKERIKKMICTMYKEKVAKYITIQQISGDINDMKENSKKEIYQIKDTLQKSTKEIAVIREYTEYITKCQNSEYREINFIDELDNCKVFCFFILVFINPIDEDFINDMIAQFPQIYKIEKYDEDVNGFTQVIFQYHDPRLQCGVREDLREIGDFLNDNGMGVIGLLSH